MWVQALAALVLLVVALLAVPVDVHWRADSTAGEKWSLRVGWLFGLVRIRRAGASADGGAAGEQEPSPTVESIPDGATPKAGTTRRKGRRRSRGMPAILRSPAFARRALRLVRTLLERVRFGRFAARLRIGLDDPADTGQLMGILLPLAVFVQLRLPGPLTVLPAFDGVALEGRAEAEMRVVPLRLIAPLLTFGAWIVLHLWVPRACAQPMNDE